MFLVYNVFLALAAVVAAPYYLLRRKYRATLVQRLGGLRAPLQQTGGRTIWLHAVSVGEVLSCQDLIRRLRARFPAAKLAVSTTTATGQQVAREKLGATADQIFYTPLDLPFAVRRTLARLRPNVVIVAETEIWPNLFQQTKLFGASLLIVNARMSDRSAPRYRRFRFFFGRVLGLADCILAQSPLDRTRLLDAGAPPEKVEVGGNLKFDMGSAEAPPVAEIVSWVQRATPDRIVLAGSTREGEEEHFLTAFGQLSEKYPRLLGILAPRHPDRFESVARLLAESGCSFLRRSQLRPDASLKLPGILLLDSLGELASVYQLADAVFIGGSLVDWGGHNVLEPAMAGRAIVVGPHMQNFRAIAEALLAAGGLLQICGPQELGSALSRLLEHPNEAARLGENARCFAKSHRGATERAVDHVERLYHHTVPRLPPSALERVLLWAPARVWGTAARARQRASCRLSAYTISVGNLTVGGTGKTPIVFWLIEQLQVRGLNCALLTRGYRRSAPEKVTIIEPGATRPLEHTGDEAQLALRRFRIPIGIAADRYTAGVEIEKRFHPDVIILDDAFQHRRLARDLDLVLLDVTDPFGRGELMPLGRLREPLDALSRAGAFLLTRTEAGETWQGIHDVVRQHNRSAPIFFSRFEPAALVDAATGREHHFSGRPAVAFCGVGNADAFWRSLEQIGLRLVERVRYPDHHRYSQSDVRRLSGLARRHNAVLVCTEKDLVSLGSRVPENLYWLRVEVIVEDAEQLLERIAIREGAMR